MNDESINYSKTDKCDRSEQRLFRIIKMAIVYYLFE